MLSLGALSLATPWALAAFAVLPAIWWLLRLTPPVPTVIRFPAVRLLLGLRSREESSAKTPPWLLILRLVLASLVIVAAAQPLLNANARFSGAGPLITIIDDGWAAAPQWADRKEMLLGLADQAERDERPMVVVTTAPAAEGRTDGPFRVLSAVDARRIFEGLQPKPWPTDRGAALAPLLAPEGLGDERPGDVVWLSDGLEEPAGRETVGDYAAGLQRLGAVNIITDPPARLAPVLRPPVADGGVLIITAERAQAQGMASVAIRAIDSTGRPLLRQPLVFPAGESRIEATLTLPTEALNRLQRLEIENARTAGAVVLTDERWRRRPVGLVSATGEAGDQPLLSDLYYLDRALQPFTEIRQGSVAELLKRPIAVMVLADPGHLTRGTLERLDGWMRDGGVVLRFAGPLLAKATSDDSEDSLLPVKLRQGDRIIGGALSWRQPAKLAPFEATSPFSGLTIPDDVTVSRQVLAQPALDLADRTWARLDDGTPLVTATREDKGWLILVHTTANADWSDLPLSGLFVDMLRRVVALSQGVAPKASGPPLEPLASLDGFGRLGPVQAQARAVPADTFDTIEAAPNHPPGYYGDNAARRALNLSAKLSAPAAIGPLPSGVASAVYEEATEVDFRPWLLGAAMILVLIDLAASLALRGLMPLVRIAALVPLLIAFTTTATLAQTGDDAFALGNSLETRLAYVITGDRQIDETSRAGLTGLNTVLKRRTAAELGPPQGVDPARHELAFFPLLYWPVTANSAALGERARANVNKYLKNGGTILFDTRNAGGSGADVGVLRQLARGINIPPLVPVPPDHVLTRAFYLIQEFPGRWAGGTLWVERAGEHVNDGVSPVIAGANDWASAWAIDDAQRPLYPTVPGGERQREMAFRFGVNLVMYTLTGNYKSDQVHIPAIMKRLGN